MAIQPQRKLGYEDYVRFPDDGRRWELMDGEAFMVLSPTTGHQDIVGRMYRRIADHLDKHGGGRVFIAPLDMGTARMGRPGEGVIDSWGKHHDVEGLFVADGSIFPTCVGVNPQVSIMAFATRTAESIAAGAV